MNAYDKMEIRIMKEVIDQLKTWEFTGGHIDRRITFWRLILSFADKPLTNRAKMNRVLNLSTNNPIIPMKEHHGDGPYKLLKQYKPTIIKALEWEINKLTVEAI